MNSVNHVTEQGHQASAERKHPKMTEHPYATLWLADKEVLLFENEDGDFFTA